MADSKISQLTGGGAAQATDEYVVARAGGNNKITGANVAAAATSVGTLTSLTVSGDLTVDTSTLKVDSTNNRVGILTASPAYALDLASGIARFDSSGGDGLRVYGGSGTNQWDVYCNSTNLRISDNTGGGSLVVDTGATIAGNLGLGVTPSAWSLGKAIEVNNVGNALWGVASSEINVSQNAYYNAAWKYASSSFASRYEQNTGAHRWYTAPSGTAGNNISFTQAMTLDASGNLGIGPTSPATRLHLSATASVDAASRMTNSANTAGFDIGLLAGISDATAYIYQRANAALLFGTNNTERARITSGGYFKASNDGTYNNSTGSYHELKSTTAGLPSTFIQNTNANPYGAVINFTSSPDNNTNYFLNCEDGTAVRCYIWSDGDLANHDGVYGTISDERLKQDIVDAGSQWDDLKAVRFRKYRMKTDVAADPNAPYQLGVIAQELEQTSPGLVDEHPDFEEQEVTDEDGNVTTERVQVGTTKTVKSSILLMKAAVALQEAMARIEALEARLEALEA